MKTFNALLVIFLISASYFFFSNNEADYDLWGHLRFGQDIYQKREIPRYDTYSYSFYGSRWINHEWLSELLFFIIFKLAKDTGLIIFKIFLGLIITAIIFISVSNQTKSTFLKLLFIIASLAVINYGFRTRPQIFTYLFFTGFIFIIDRFEKTSNGRLLYGMPLIALAWCNLHGGFVVGIGILLLYLLFRIFEKRATKELLIITALTILVTFINPYGKELWIFLFKTLLKPRPSIIEWQRLKLSLNNLHYFIILSLTIIGIFSSRLKRSHYEMAALLIGFLYSFKHNRHMVLFAILSAIYMPKYINSFTRDWLIGWEKRLSHKFFIAVLISLSLYFFFMAPYRGSGNPLKIRIPEEVYPLDAIDFMKENKISGNAFVFFNWAEMFIKEFADTNRVFFDGRYMTVYSYDFIKDYFDILYGKKDYRDYLKKFPETDIMLLHRFNPLAHNLIEDRDWVLVYTSYNAWIFLKDNRKNRQIIGNFRDKGLIRSRERETLQLDLN